MKEHTAGVNDFIIQGIGNGSSMLPFIKPDAHLQVRVYATASYGIGDIVVFIKNKTFIAHRIIGLTNKGKHRLFIVKGDNNDDTDGLISHKRIIGRVEEIHRNGQVIRLLSWKHKVLRYPFVLYSRARPNATVQRFIWRLWKIDFLQRLYQKVVE